MLLMATALGFGSALTSGKALSSRPLARLFDLQDGEVPLCFVSLGTVSSQRPRPERPGLAAFVSELAPEFSSPEPTVAPSPCAFNPIENL
jgi:nitroreductase